MFLTSLLIGAVIGGLVVYFWKEIVSFVQKVLSLIPEEVIYEVKILLRWVSGQLVQVVKVFKNKKWWEFLFRRKYEEKTRIVNENDVPKEIREQLRNSKEVDITQRVQLELQH